ncbi:MAG TPA: SdrD B-like domain-containing protein [Candidatus Krumholzibacteria bacterium]|nr:SdrD B-like domain-containing protein [Candidatus Krumholzibacteria bacterium]HPD70836.1 SdrD B-like domain-containing protein [Candidatus Krumholzibacteria bacterium]HRY39464.1 SdrD B-like domain-containing protein [Candidatus Krumholzibacteria bacterium]
MRSIQFIPAVLGCLLLLASCSHEPPTQPATDDLSAPGPAFAAIQSAAQALINNFVVQYDGRTFDGEATTFRYTVFGNGVEPDLNHFSLELPDCAPPLASYDPTAGAVIRYNSPPGFFGIKWRLTIPADDPVGRQYAISFPGDVPEGEIRGAVKAGTSWGVGLVPGPCAGYLISGAVYVDADRDGARDPDEWGIPGVVVELRQGDAVVDTARTDGTGDYSLLQGAGDYTVRIGPGAYPDAFNAELFASFDATTIAELDVTVGPDSPGNDFGFAPQSEEIVEELESGVLVSDGESALFWKHQLRAILRGRPQDSIYDRETLEAFVAQIQAMYLTEVYHFTPGNELQEAFAILKSQSEEPIDILLTELLATEFNEVSGRGLTGDDAALQDMLIAWGEAVVVENVTLARAGAANLDLGAGGPQIGLAVDVNVPIAIQLFHLINTGGGGGVDEKR